MESFVYLQLFVIKCRSMLYRVLWQKHRKKSTLQIGGGEGTRESWSLVWVKVKIFGSQNILHNEAQNMDLVNFFFIFGQDSAEEQKKWGKEKRSNFIWDSLLLLSKLTAFVF